MKTYAHFYRDYNRLRPGGSASIKLCPGRQLKPDEPLTELSILDTQAFSAAIIILHLHCESSFWSIVDANKFHNGNGKSMNAPSGRDNNAHTPNAIGGFRR